MDGNINPKNINKDYVITVNAKNSTLTASNNLVFYITDKNTSNIFFELTFEDKDNKEQSIKDLINSWAPKENIDDYILTLRIVMPNNRIKIIEDIDRLNDTSDFFMVDLPRDCMNQLGIYLCEMFIETKINGREERSTTNSFTYQVIPSIFNNLDDEVEQDPEYPLIDSIVDQFKALDYATREYVDEQLEILEDYATLEHVNSAIADINNSIALMNESINEQIGLINEALIEVIGEETEE